MKAQYGYTTIDKSESFGTFVRPFLKYILWQNGILRKGYVFKLIPAMYATYAKVYDDFKSIFNDVLVKITILKQYHHHSIILEEALSKFYKDSTIIVDFLLKRTLQEQRPNFLLLY